MSRILKDYKCQEHGYFEGYSPTCPQGCTDYVLQVFLQAPGFKSDKTKNADAKVALIGLIVFAYKCIELIPMD